MVGLVLRFWPEYVELRRRWRPASSGARSRCRPTASRRPRTGTTGWATRRSPAASRRPAHPRLRPDELAPRRPAARYTPIRVAGRATWQRDRRLECRPRKNTDGSALRNLGCGTYHVAPSTAGRPHVLHSPQGYMVVQPSRSDRAAIPGRDLRPQAHDWSIGALSP